MNKKTGFAGFNFAEEAGFEPAVGYSTYNGFQDHPVKPSSGTPP